VAYRSIPKVQRARAHAEVGEWVEELAGSRREEFVELLAFHFGAAAASETAELAWERPAVREQVRARAFRHLVDAGAAARCRFAVAKAVDLHTQAGALAATEGKRRVALEQLGDDEASAYHGEEATAWWARALDSARADPSGRADRARLCRKLAWIMASTPGAFRSSPDPLVVDQLVDEGLAAAGDELDRAWLLLAWGVSARLWRGTEPFGQGRDLDPVPIGKRIADVERAMAAGEAAGDLDLTTSAASALNVLYGVAGRYREVRDLDRRTLEHLDQVGPRLDQADIIRTAAANAIMISARFEEALELARRAHTLSAGANPHQRMHATWPIIAALYHLGRWGEALPVVDEHTEAFRQDPAPGCSFVRDGSIIGAAILTHRGELGRARALAALVGPPTNLATASAWQARFATASGDPATAVRISEDKARERRLYGQQHLVALLEALAALEDWGAVAELLPEARARAEGNALLGPVTDRVDGLALAHAGRTAEAGRTLRRALAGFERLGERFEAAGTREPLASLAEAPEARALLEAALATYEELACAPCARAVRDRLRGLS